MPNAMTGLEAADREHIFVPHAFPETLADLGEIRMNYSTAGEPHLPALLLIPGQSESWWGYEAAMPLLAEHFHVHAADLRGQGRSTWTPGRYTLDNIGNDLVRFIDLVIGRPTVVSGLSSGGVLSAWLSAYAKPGQVRGAVWEDPPLFSSEINPACGQSIRQAIGPMFAMWNKWLGDQWSIGDWPGMLAAAPRELPERIVTALVAMAATNGGEPANLAEPPQNLKEYDPEWGRAFWTGTVAASCDNALMLANVKAPILFTHHFRQIDEATGALMGALSDLQAARARELVESAGQPFEYQSFPRMPHSMHGADPALFARTVTQWASALPAEAG